MTATAQERLVDVEVKAAIEDRVPAGAEKTFRSYDPDQVLLMAPVLQEWVPDGAKLRANASRHKAMSYDRMVRAEGQLEGEIAALREKVDALLADAERVDAEEDERFGRDRRGDELPAELQRREQRLATIREAKQALEAEAHAAETARRAELRAQGKKPRKPKDGRDPFAP